MRIKVLVVLAAAVLGLVLFIAGCNASPREVRKDAVKLSEASVGDIVVFGDIRWYVIARTETSCTVLAEKPVIKLPFTDFGGPGCLVHN